MKCWHWEPFEASVDFRRALGQFGVDLWGEPALGSDRAMVSSPRPSVEPTLPGLCFWGCSQLSSVFNLARELGLPGFPTDSNLILHAYAKWGCNAVYHLKGRFSFAVWDSAARILFACRDHLGTLPFVYTMRGQQLSFAGDMQTLLARIPTRTLCPQILSACVFPSQSDMAPGETLFTGVSSLPPGHYLVASANDVSVKRYWEPAIRERLIPAREDEVFEKAAELVESAVSTWLDHRSSVALMFSGGLDSSILAVVAAKYLKKSNRTLLALGAVNQFAEPGIPDERTYMEGLSGLDNMSLRYVPAIGRGPFDGIEDASLFATSCFRYSRKFLEEEIAGVAAADGADILLGGGWGEATISDSPHPYLLECAVHFRWGPLLSLLRNVSAATGYRPIRILGAEVKRHLMAPPPRLPGYFLAPGFLAAHPARLFPRVALWPDTRQTQLRTIRRTLASDALMSTRPRSSVFAPASPFQDVALLEFCLALPACFKVRNGTRRYLAKRAFAHLMPDAVAWRATKMPFSPDYNLRYNSQLPKALAFIDGIRKSDPIREVVDVDRLKAFARPAPAETALHYSPAVGPVPRTIYLINFLRQFPAFRL